MAIDDYCFGRIVVDGKEYRSDLILVADDVKPDWWRKQGHRLAPDDLAAVLAAKPERLVIGTGASGCMTVPAETIEFLKEKGIKPEVMPTGQASKRFNLLRDEGAIVAGAFHLTC